MSKKTTRYEHHRAPTNINALKGKCARFQKKARYRSHEEAVDVLHILQNRGKADLALHGTTDRNECRVYKCNVCKGFHLSSQKEWGTPTQSDYRKAA